MSTNGFMRVFISLVILSVFAFGSVGRITAISGSVTVERGGVGQKATPNFKLEEKDQIKSLAGATAQIIFNDKTVITVGSNTTFKIEEYLYDEKDVKARFGVGEGSFKAITGKIAKIAPEKFKVETKTATIGIRGTIFIGNINRAGILTIACTKGAISVTPNIPSAPPVIVQQGQITRADTKGVEPPRASTPADLKGLEKEVTTDKKAQGESGGGGGQTSASSGSTQQSQAVDSPPTAQAPGTSAPIAQTLSSAVLSTVNNAVNNAVNDIKNTQTADLAAAPAQTPAAQTAEPIVNSGSVDVATTNYQYLNDAKAKGDLSVLGAALLSQDTAIRSAAASILSSTTTISAPLYTIVSEGALSDNALMVTYGGVTKYFKYIANTNAYGTDMTFSSIGELIAGLQAFTGSNVKFYLDPKTNQISYGMLGGASALSISKVNSNDFLGFINTSSTPSYMPTGALQYSRSGLGITKLSDGSVLVVGGFNYSPVNYDVEQVEKYNPTTGVWTTITPSGSSNLRMGFGITTLNDGNVLVAGGGDGWGAMFNTVDVYDVASNTWISKTPLPSRRNGLRLATLPNGNVLAIGGYDTDNSTYLKEVLVYNPTANSWTSVASMNTARNTFGSVTLPSGNVLVMGGYSVYPASLDSVEMYDYVANSWSYKASMLSARAGLSSVVLLDGSVLAIGGNSSSGTTLNSVEQYNPTTNTWQYKVPLPFTFVNGGAVTLNDGSVLIVSGSQDGAVSVNSWIYNPNQSLTTSVNTILAADYNAGVNNGFFIGSASNISSKVVGNINSMLFNADLASVSTTLGDLSGVNIAGWSGYQAANTFAFSRYTSLPSGTSSFVNYVGEDNKIIWGQATINNKAGTIGFASLPDKVDNANTLSNVSDFSSWGYWEAMTSDATEYYSGYWVSGQPTSDAYIQQMVNQGQSYNYSGHVAGDTLNGTTKDAIVLNSSNKLSMSINFGQSNPVKVNSLGFVTSQGWTYSQGANLTNPYSTMSGNGYTATVGNSVNTSDALNMQGKFYGPQANSTGGVFSGQLTGTDSTSRAVQGVFKADR